MPPLTEVAGLPISTVQRGAAIERRKMPNRFGELRGDTASTFCRRGIDQRFASLAKDLIVKR